jgi:hypothetical protein
MQVIARHIILISLYKESVMRWKKHVKLILQQANVQQCMIA